LALLAGREAQPNSKEHEIASANQRRTQ
jgi:hypothetical protein